MYRIYAHQKEKGWIIVDVKIEQEEALEVAESLNSENYYSYIVVKVDNTGETVIKRGDFTRENFVNKLKVDKKQMVTEKQSRMKKKEALRKLTEKYMSGKDFNDDDYLNY